VPEMTEHENVRHPIAHIRKLCKLHVIVHRKSKNKGEEKDKTENIELKLCFRSTNY
jgi:hypothetical protein